MEKQKMLTICRPIRNNDTFIVRIVGISPTTPLQAKNGDKYINTTTLKIHTYDNGWDNGKYIDKNKIYNIIGTNTYKRLVDNKLVDRDYVEFPEIGNPLEIFKFTYESQRMGKAPAITADAMWKDCLDNMWTMDCFVYFNGERYYLRQSPSSSKSNDDARYKHQLLFISERVVLEDILLFDIVTPYTNEKPITESATFSFFGDIKELRKRVNASLVHSGISKYVFRQGVTKCPTLKEWNSWGNEVDTNHKKKYDLYNGNYNTYLQTEIYEYDSNTDEFKIDGYQVIIGRDASGKEYKSEEKFVPFDKNTIYDALQSIDEIFGIKYYFKGKYIYIADAETFFGDDTFEYGWDKALLSVEKANDTEKVINKCSGIGSTENIPYYYPNPTEDGFLKPKYVSELQGNTMIVKSKENDAFNKNHLSDTFVFGYLFPKSNEWILQKDENTNKYQHVYQEQIPNGFDWRECCFNFEITTNYGTIQFKEDFPIGTLQNDHNLKQKDIRYYLKIYKKNEKVTQSQPQAWVELKDFAKIHKNEIENHSIITLPKGIYKIEGWQGIKDTIGKSIIKGYYRNDGGKFTYVMQDKYYELNIPNKTSFLKDDLHIKPYLFVNAQFTDQWVGNKTSHDYLIKLENVQDTFNKETFAKLNVKSCKVVYVNETKLQWNVFPKFDYTYRYDEARTAGSIITTYNEDPNYSNKLADFLWYDIKNDLYYKYDYSTNQFIEIEYNGNALDTQEINAIKIINDQKSFGLYYTENRWFTSKGKKVDINNFGLIVTTTTNPNAISAFNDKIVFERIKYLTPQSTLMPEIYYKTDGERRFYNAKNYPILNATQNDVDEDSGERLVNGKIENPIYHDDEKIDKPNEYNQYAFTNEYSQIRPKEHIENFEDIKPTIVGMKNLFGNRIDIAEEFAYDESDNNETWNVSDENSATLEYKHPHFFVKLRPLGFNLFDCALEKGDMTIAMTSGMCGSCQFKIKVDSKTLKNPVQIWEYDVYERISLIPQTFKKVFSKGDLKRAYKEKTFYKRNENGMYVKINTDFFNNIYSSEEYKNERIGSIKVDGKEHFEGDIVTFGKFQDEQQDTTNNYVWVALEKDVNTYGVIMPSANPIYNNGEIDIQLSSYIRPKASIDTFVFTNILLPQKYIRDAEEKLSKAIVKYMADHNNWKFNFSIHFSRIYLNDNPKIIENLNENSKLRIKYNGVEYIVYVSSYKYNIGGKNELPDITIDLRETINTIQYNILKKLGGDVVSKNDDSTIAIKQVLDITDKRYVSTNGNARINGTLMVGKNAIKVNEDIEESKVFQNKINALSLDGDSENDGIRVMRQKQKDLIEKQQITSTTVDSIAKSKSELIERSNDIMKLMDNLQKSITDFNKANDGLIKPIPDWKCVNISTTELPICKELPELIDNKLKPLSE